MSVNRVGNRHGVATVTAATGGNATIRHGLCRMPTAALVTMHGDNTVHVDIESFDAGSLVLHFKAASNGADVTSGDFTVSWLVMQ